MSNVPQARSARCLRTDRNRDKYSNSTKNFKQRNTREDSSDLDEKDTEFIAAMGSTSGKKLSTPLGLQKNSFKTSLFRETLFEYLSL